jgi:hypothetical protein
MNRKKQKANGKRNIYLVSTIGENEIEREYIRC